MEIDIENEEHKFALQQLLPLKYNGRVIKTENLPNNGFATIIRISLTSKEAALQWLNDFQEKSKITYRVERSNCENTQKVLFKKVYRCMHNTRPRRTATPHPKHLNCKAKLTITIKQSGMKKSKDVYLKNYPCEIFLRHNHNHPFDTSTVLKYRPPSRELEKDFKALFEKGYSPTRALSIFKEMLHEEYKEKYIEVVEDGQKCPTRKWVYDLYYKIFKKGYIKQKKIFNKVNNRSECHNMEDCHENINECSQISTKSPKIKMEKKEVVQIQSENTIHESSFTTEESKSETVINTIDIRNQLQEFVDLLMKKYENNLKEYDKPIHEFIQNFKLCKTDSSLISALGTFGKHNGAGVPQNSMGEHNVENQPTSVARRKTPLGRKNAFHSSPKRLCLSD